MRIAAHKIAQVAKMMGHTLRVSNVPPSSMRMLRSLYDKRGGVFSHGMASFFAAGCYSDWSSTSLIGGGSFFSSAGRVGFTSAARPFFPQTIRQSYFCFRRHGKGVMSYQTSPAARRISSGVWPPPPERSGSVHGDREEVGAVFSVGGRASLCQVMPSQ